MKQLQEALLIKVPRNKTALMQHLQMLVVRRHFWWCGGTISTTKLSIFLEKMVCRYPITRNTRGRSYDRTRGLASLHFVVFPLKNNQVVWWLLSDDGKGGLNDSNSPDAHVAKHAMAAEGHIHFIDYTLHYAHKKDARKVPDARTGKEKLVLKNMSTWTWKLTDSAYNETKAAIETAAAKLEFGNEGGQGRSPWGILGILACQRSRPLFAGVRNQVLALHRHADTHWERVKKKWQWQHSGCAMLNLENAGELRTLEEVTCRYLPKMTRIAVYGGDFRSIKDMIT